MTAAPELHYKADAARARAMRMRAGLALAVLLAAAAFAWAVNPGPQWRVADSQVADGNVLLDDDPIPAVDVEALGELLLAGTTIEWRGHGDLEFVSEHAAVLALAPGTVVTLPAPPPRWFARAVSCSLAEGTLRFVPGPDFRGATLTIHTPARTFTGGGADAFEIRHDPLTGKTALETTGPTIMEFAQKKRPELAH
jgi:hypothetical protein